MSVMKNLINCILTDYLLNSTQKSYVDNYAISIINVKSDYEYTMGIDKQSGVGMTNIIKIDVDDKENIINMTGYIDDDKLLNDCIEALKEIYSDSIVTGLKCIPVIIKPKMKKVRIKQYLEYEVEIPVNTDKIEINCYCCGEECDIFEDTILKCEEIK